MADIVFELRGLEKIKVDKFARQLSDARVPIRAAMKFTKLALKRDARQGKKIGGGRFAPYAESYIDWLIVNGKYGGKKWLALEGKMLDAIKTRAGKRTGAVGYLRESRNAKKARAHNYGSSKQGIPAREFMGWRPRYIRWITDRVFFPWLERIAEQNGIDFGVSF